MLELYLQWSDIEHMNVDGLDQELKNRLENIVINECCCLVYTVSYPCSGKYSDRLD